MDGRFCFGGDFGSSRTELARSISEGYTDAYWLDLQANPHLPPQIALELFLREIASCRSTGESEADALKGALLIIDNVEDAVLQPQCESLQCARAVQGIGAAILLPNSLAALNHTVQDPERRKIAVSAWSSAGALGVAVGPLVGGLLVQYLDWRSIFLVNIPVGLVGLWLARRHVAVGPRNTQREFAPIGQILAVVTLAVLTYWMISLGRSHGFSAFTVLLGGGVIALGAAFVWVESREANPLLPLDLLFKPGLGSVAIVGLLHNVGIYGLIFALSLVFQELRGMTPVGAGLLFLPLTLSLVAGTRAGGKFLRKSDPFAPQIWGHAISAFGAIGLAVTGFSHSFTTIAISLCLIGLGAGSTVPSMNLSALDSVELERSGLASGHLEQRPADWRRHRSRIAGCSARRLCHCSRSEVGFRSRGNLARRRVCSCGSHRPTAQIFSWLERSSDGDDT